MRGAMLLSELWRLTVSRRFCYSIKKAAFLLLGAKALAVAFIVGLWAPQTHAEPDVVGEAALLMELHTGKVVWTKNENKRLAPASTTKILTALVALERSPLEQIVTVSDHAAATEGSSTYLRPGERISLEDLLYAGLLQSGNDAAIAIAEGVAGSTEEFVRMMNETAQRLGAKDSSFLNPHGLPLKGHYTTAKDLALITRAAMQNPKFREIVGTRIRPWNGEGWKGTLVNHNRLLGDYKSAIGVKTGYTVEAGQCLVAAARRGGATYLAVVLNSQSRAIWEDARGLLDYAFKNYAVLEFAKEGETVLIVDVDGRELPLDAAAPVRYLVPRNRPAKPRYRIVLDELKPPIAEGEQLGEVVFGEGKRELRRVALVAGADVQEPDSLHIIFWIGLVAALGIFIHRRRKRRHRFNRYRFSRRLRF